MKGNLKKRNSRRRRETVTVNECLEKWKWKKVMENGGETKIIMNEKPKKMEIFRFPRCHKSGIHFYS
jgi:hypothetical protein